MQTVAPVSMPDRCSAWSSGEGSDNAPPVSGCVGLPSCNRLRRETVMGPPKCTRNKNYEKRSSRGEQSLRLCGIAFSCEPATEVENASPVHIAIRRACRSKQGSRRAADVHAAIQSLPSWLQKLGAWGGEGGWRLMPGLMPV